MEKIKELTDIVETIQISIDVIAVNEKLIWNDINKLKERLNNHLNKK